MDTQETQRKILRAIADIQGPSSAQGVTDAQIAEHISLDVQEIQDNLELLENKGLVQLAKAFGPSYSACFTAQGRTLLRDPSYGQAGAPTQVINVLNIIDSHIHNLAQAGNNAVISQPTDSTINDKIIEVIDEMIEAVRSSEITPELKRDYELEAAGLKAELKKSKLNLPRIREMLSFLGDAEGTLGLATRLAPYLIALAPYISQLFR
jgi:Fe2+ or Zn2+ uptake regulation protein